MSFSGILQIDHTHSLVRSCSHEYAHRDFRLWPHTPAPYDLWDIHQFERLRRPLRFTAYLNCRKGKCVSPLPFYLSCSSLSFILLMKSLCGIHWATPVTMISTLLAECLLSLSHHLFYARLAGTDAPTGKYAIAGTSISKQKFNTAVGTAFAFLVKSMLTLAVATAYIQVFWRSMKVSEKGQRLSTLDTTFSILSNVFNFAKLHVWIKYPLPFLLATIAWYVIVKSM